MDDGELELGRTPSSPQAHDTCPEAGGVMGATGTMRSGGIRPGREAGQAEVGTMRSGGMRSGRAAGQVGNVDMEEVEVFLQRGLR